MKQYLKKLHLAFREKNFSSNSLRVLLRMINHIFRHPLKVFTNKRPRFFLAVTNSCQCHCLHCGFNSPHGEHDHQLSYEEICRILDEISSWPTLMTTVSLFGGEPMMNSEIYKIIAYASRLGLIIDLETNGIALNRENVSNLKKAGISHIYVSLDSPNASIHDQIRGHQGCFNKVVDAVAHCVDQGIPCSISVCAFKETVNSGELEGIIALAKQLMVTSIRFLFPRPSGRLAHQKEVLLNPEEKRKVWALLEPGFSYVESPFLSYKDGYDCCAARAGRVFYITDRGDVSVCPYSSSFYGNIRKKALSQIISSILSDLSFKRGAIVLCEEGCHD